MTKASLIWHLIMLTGDSKEDAFLNCALRDEMRQMSKSLQVTLFWCLWFQETRIMWQ